MSTVPVKLDPAPIAAEVAKLRLEFTYKPDVRQGGEVVKRWVLTVDKDQEINARKFTRLGELGFELANGYFSIVRCHP